MVGFMPSYSMNLPGIPDFIKNLTKNRSGFGPGKKKSAPKPQGTTSGSVDPAAIKRALNPMLPGDIRQYEMAQTLGVPEVATEQSANLYGLPDLPTGTLDPTTLEQLRQLAGIDARSEFEPQINQITRQMGSARETAKVAGSDLDVIYRALVNELNKLPGQVQANYGGAQQKVGANFADLIKQTDANYGAATQGVGNELAQLGLQTAAPNALGGLQGDQQFIQGMNKNAGANADAALEILKQGMGGIAQGAVGSARMEGAGQQAGVIRDLTNLLAELEGQKSDLISGQSLKSQSLLEKLKLGQQDSQQQQFENELKLHSSYRDDLALQNQVSKGSGSAGAQSVYAQVTASGIPNAPEVLDWVNQTLATPNVYDAATGRYNPAVALTAAGSLADSKGLTPAQKQQFINWVLEAID